MDKQTMRRTVRFKGRDIETLTSDFSYQNEGENKKSRKEKN